jgi:hypothetical protein
VEKVIVSRQQIHHLCNSLVPNSSANNASSILFDALNKKRLYAAGLYGNRGLMTEFLRKEQLLSVEACDSLANEPHSLSPGLYGIFQGEFAFLLLWQDEKAFANISRKDLTCNLIRYMTELCENLVCFVAPKEVISTN